MQWGGGAEITKEANYTGISQRQVTIIQSYADKAPEHCPTALRHCCSPTEAASGISPSASIEAGRQAG